jgi:hypothetical protein
MSVVPPAGNGTTIFTGLFGYWAHEMLAANANTPIAMGLQSDCTNDMGYSSYELDYRPVPVLDAILVHKSGKIR